MYELLLLAILVTLAVLAMRRGKPAGYQPLIIQRAGQYHITLDPQLGHAQAFLELVAEQFAAAGGAAGDVAGQFYELRDPGTAAGAQHYLLALAQRSGVLYIQAIKPGPLLRDSDSHLSTIRAFSDAVLALQPIAGAVDAPGADKLRATLMAASARSNMVCTSLQN